MATSNVKPLGIGVIGLGIAVKPHALALRDLEGRATRVTGVFSRDPERRARFGEAYRFPVATDVDALIDAPETDAILLLTPPDAREAFIRRCAAAGKPVLMEKPVERTVAAAQALVDIMAAARLPFGMVLQHRMREASIAFRNLLAEGRLGRIAMARLVVPWWREQAYYDEPGRGTLARDGGGVLITQAIHPIDLMLDLLGPAAEVQALTATTILHRMESEDFATAGFRFASGALGSIVATTAAFPGAAERLSVDAENGSAELHGGELVVSWRDGSIERFGAPAATGSGADPMAFDHGPHRSVIADFAEAVATGRPPAITAASAMPVHQLIEAMLESSREGRVVRLG
ncbi:MAG: Gfo/Idh/MocA family protein [Beijerinckiaceae bacterium]